MPTADRAPRLRGRRRGVVTVYASLIVTLAALAQILNLPNLSTHREARSAIMISATADTVWALLTDLTHYTVWNPYISPAKGNIKEGAPLELTLHNGDQTVIIAETVLSVKPDHELSWGGWMLDHNLQRTLTFSIDQVGPDQVWLDAHEVFQGILLPFVGNIPDDAQHGLDEMVRALRSAAELKPPHSP
ncbi:MAG TPA: SRPBCC domain-containing protein [bacterium]|nr:SRPBCC domain-containing protein [bacterium]